jgi:hypothetical protein
MFIWYNGVEKLDWSDHESYQGEIPMNVEVPLFSISWRTVAILGCSLFVVWFIIDRCTPTWESRNRDVVLLVLATTSEKY